MDLDHNWIHGTLVKCLGNLNLVDLDPAWIHRELVDLDQDCISSKLVDHDQDWIRGKLVDLG